MENASKALIIAGAILLAILIIGLGVYIYNQASNTVSDTGMDQIAIRQFNAQFEPYIMDNASGATAMALYDTVYAHNAVAAIDQKVRLNLINNPIEGAKAIKLASKSTVKEIDETKAGVKDEAKEEEYITFSKSALSTTKKYNITVGRYDAGVIKQINIEVVR